MIFGLDTGNPGSLASHDPDLGGLEKTERERHRTTGVIFSRFDPALHLHRATVVATERFPKRT